jgi:hypothetical protein
MPKIHQQQHPLLLRLVPHFMLVAIIKDKAFPFLPLTDLVPDTDPAR